MRCKYCNRELAVTVATVEKIDGRYNVQCEHCERYNLLTTNQVEDILGQDFVDSF